MIRAETAAALCLTIPGETWTQQYLEAIYQPLEAPDVRTGCTSYELQAEAQIEKQHGLPAGALSYQFQNGSDQQFQLARSERTPTEVWVDTVAEMGQTKTFADLAQQNMTCTPLRAAIIRSNAQKFLSGLTLPTVKPFPSDVSTLPTNGTWAFGSGTGDARYKFGSYLVVDSSGHVTEYSNWSPPAPFVAFMWQDPNWKPTNPTEAWMYKQEQGGAAWQQVLGILRQFTRTYEGETYTDNIYSPNVTRYYVGQSATSSGNVANPAVVGISPFFAPLVDLRVTPNISSDQSGLPIGGVWVNEGEYGGVLNQSGTSYYYYYESCSDD